MRGGDREYEKNHVLKDYFEETAKRRKSLTEMKESVVHADNNRINRYQFSVCP